jgi:phenylpyruvate tautomerase PptA (4-oxalocrotonate tautomerase family)
MNFTKLLRTPHSEVWGITENEEMIGRIDIHYDTDESVDVSVLIKQKLTQEQELELCEKIDENLVENAELSDENFTIVVSQVDSVNVYGKEDD